MKYLFASKSHIEPNCLLNRSEGEQKKMADASSRCLREFGVIFTVSISDLRINAVDCIMICDSQDFF